MRVRVPSQNLLAAMTIISLGLLTLCAASGGPPEVAISDLHLIDGGAVVSVKGLTVEAWSSDTSYWTLVIAELEGLSTVKVVCAPGRITTELEAHIGDEVRATGELDTSGGQPILWSSCDDVVTTRESRDALTLGLLASAWALLVNDRFEIRGVLVSGSDAGSYWLTDPEDKKSMAVRFLQHDPSRFVDSRVVVEGVLKLESVTMRLVLDVETIVASS